MVGWWWPISSFINFRDLALWQNALTWWYDDTLNVRTNLKNFGEKKWQKRRMTWCHSVCPSCLFRRGHARNTAMSSHLHRNRFIDYLHLADVQLLLDLSLPWCNYQLALVQTLRFLISGHLPDAEACQTQKISSFLLRGLKPNGKWRKTKN